MSTKTLSLRMNDSDYRFLSGLAKEEGEDISKTVRELIDLGRVALAHRKIQKIRGIHRKSSTYGRCLYFKNDGYSEGAWGRDKPGIRGLSERAEVIAEGLVKDF